MTPLHELIASPLFERLGWVLLHFVWEGFVIAAALAVLLAALRHAAPNVRYLVSCGAMLGLAVLPAITFALLPATHRPMPLASAKPKPFLRAAVEPSAVRQIDASARSRESISMPQRIEARGGAPETIAVKLRALID